MSFARLGRRRSASALIPAIHSCAASRRAGEGFAGAAGDVKFDKPGNPLAHHLT